MLRGVPLYNFSGERFFETLQPAQVIRVICLQFNKISMLNSALEKMEHLSRKNLEQVLERIFCRVQSLLFLMHIHVRTQHTIIRDKYAAQS